LFECKHFEVLEHQQTLVDHPAKYPRVPSLKDLCAKTIHKDQDSISLLPLELSECIQKNKEKE
jgi:hypothetical protein